MATSTAVTAEAVIEVRGAWVRYGHVEALRGADFIVPPRSITALVGDNGAGKSTLVKVISGVITPDEGTVHIDGHEVQFDHPSEARDAGVETIYQDLAIAPHLGAATNIFLGREVLKRGLLGRLGVLDKREMEARAMDVIRSLHITITDPNVALSSLSGGQQQGVAVARGAAFAKRLVLMDEPTAALGVAQRQQVHNLMRRIRESGVAVVFISHDIPEVLEIADTVQVMRQGRRVAFVRSDETTTGDVVALMAGASMPGEATR